MLVTGMMLPSFYMLAGVIPTPPRWLSFVTGALLLAGFLLIGRLVRRIRCAMWSDGLFVTFIADVVPVIVTAQRRTGEGAGLVEKMRVALRHGEGRDALRHAVEVRALQCFFGGIRRRNLIATFYAKARGRTPKGQAPRQTLSSH